MVKVKKSRAGQTPNSSLLWHHLLDFLIFFTFVSFDSFVRQNPQERQQKTLPQ